MFVRCLLCVAMVIPGVFLENVTLAKDIFNFQQSDYHVIPERTEVIRYNRDYIKHFEIRNIKYNRTTHALNMTLALKIGLGNDLIILTQLYKFMSNEYRYFPIRVQIYLCDVLEKNIFGLAKLKRCGNFTQCPLEKDITYHACNWALDESKYPPLIPGGRYMAELQGTYFGTEIFLVRAYATVKVPFFRK